MRPSSLALTLALFTAQAAIAQTPPRGVTKVGDVAVFVGQTRADRTSYEDTVTVTEVTADQIKTKNVRTGRPEDMEGVFTKDWGTIVSGTSGARFEPASNLLAFPLEPGKQWEAKYRMTFRSGGQAQVEMQAKVVGPEKIKVPAGEFDTIRVDNKGYTAFQAGPGRGGFHLTQSVWYAPAIDRIVKLELKEQRTMGADNVIELKQFTPAK